LTGTPDSEPKANRWAERPRLGAFLAVGIAAVPVLGAIGAAFVLHRVVPVPGATRSKIWKKGS